jgi:hypothetical protein
VAYSAVEARKNGDVFRKASADGSDARARAPTSAFAMMSGDGRGRVVVRFER